MNWYMTIAIAVSAIVTIALRAVPFVAFGGDKKPPAFVDYLGKTLPYAVMGMLVVFCMKSTSFALLAGWVPQLIASIVVVVSYVWKKNTIVSIVLGTAVYMVLIQMVFV